MRQLERLRQVDELSGCCSKYGSPAVVKMKKNYEAAMFFFFFFVLPKKKKKFACFLQIHSPSTKVMAVVAIATALIKAR